VSGILNVERPNPNYLHWPDLDMDLTVESVRIFPLISKSRAPIRSRRQTKTKAISQSKSDPRSTPIGTPPGE
jgi:hypothetical protein